MSMSRFFCALLAAVIFLDCGSIAFSQDIVREDVRIPMAAAGPRGLEALVVRANDAGRHPLVLVNHGSPREASERPNMTPLGLVPEAIEFVRRGWTAAIVMRRGYGDSGGGWAEDYGGCRDPNYLIAGRSSASDLEDAIGFLAKRPEIDATRVVSVGVSAGGFATVALTAEHPEGLVAAVNFAGGRGSLTPDSVCREDKLVAAFSEFGKTSRIPMLWVYSQNDHFFGPALADKFKDAFTGQGGVVSLVRAAAFGDDGHHLFSVRGAPIWTGYVDEYLKSRNLVIRRDLLPLPGASIPAPKALSAHGRESFSNYLADAPHKAFAMSPRGPFGWVAARKTIDEAKAGALEFCRKGAADCRVIVVDDVVLR
jgi:pimeloyl-ACP methyl ester carboxylesterase